MTTIAAALTQAADAFAGAGIETPRLDARLLLLWVLKCRREDLAREPERRLTDREQIIYEKAVSLRAGRRPLPYITGEAWFYGRPFKINRAVLIPRPETEMLVDAAQEICLGNPAPLLADIGTGSGCLAVTLASEIPNSTLWATDLSPDALKLARKNVVRYALEPYVTLLPGDMLASLPPTLRCDVIVSNPPYLTEAELDTLQPEVQGFEPRLALSGDGAASGPDGTGLHRRLLTESAPYLKPGGWLLMEVGQGQSEIVAEASREAGYAEVAIRPDMAGIGRVVLSRRAPCLSW